MKKLLVVLFFLTPLCASFGQACAPAPSGLVSWWPGETNANDVVGTNNGTFQGSVMFTNGEVGAAFSFNSSGYVTIPDSPSLHNVSSNVTIEAWIQGGGGEWGTAVGKGNTWNLRRYAGTTTMCFTTASLNSVDMGGTKRFDDGQWHHVAGVYDGTTKFLYVDGALDASAPATGLLAQNGTPVEIGQNSDQGLPWSGLVDEVSVYSRALSASEIQAIYAAGSAGKCGPTKIISQPTNQAVTIGNTATMTVTAIGSPPLIYQWSLYGTNISGATNSSLTFANVQLTNAGVYSVVVGSGVGGFLTSSNAVLQVLPLDAPSIQINGTPAVGSVIAIDSALVTISGGFPNGFIFYTLDGTQPSFSSTLYTGPFTLTNSAPIQAMSLSEDFSDSAFAPAIQLQIKTLYNLLTSVSGSGAIAATPPTGPYFSDSVVTLTATPAANWLFDHWTGDAGGTQNPLSLTMNGPKTVQAVFAPVPLYDLQTSVTGNGTIGVNPPTGPYISNSIVVLTATPAQHWAFDHWTGDATGSQNPLSVTMNGPRNVQAVFLPSEYPLTLSTPGGGSVTANGQLISPATYFPVGSVVSVAAITNAGWSFLGWQGDASGAVNPLNVTMNQAYNIQADFGTVVGMNPVGGGRIIFSQANPAPYGTALIASAVPDPGKYFVVWSGALTGTNAPAQLVVTNPNPKINALFGALPGGKFSLAVAVLGNGSVSISPQKSYYTPGDNVTLSAATTNAGATFHGWTGDASGTNSFIGVVVNSNMVVYANFATLPTVEISPPDQVVYVGSNALLTAVVDGLPPFTYQWQNSLGNIAGETNATYTIVNATNSDSYTVVVSNPFGSVTSYVATVTVVFPPSITVQPTNEVVAAGTPATLQVVATGTAPLSYQWWNGSGPIAGATNATLTFNPAQTNNSDIYAVVITNAYGVQYSSVATLTVYVPVNISSGPASQVVSNGAAVTMSVQATGLPDPSYQWFLNGTNILGATSNTLIITHVRTNNLGDYTVLVSNLYSSAFGGPATLSMSPSIVSAFGGLTGIWGESATLSVGAVGSGVLGYQWFMEGVALAGATNATYFIPTLDFTNGGLYSVVVSSDLGSVTNTPAQLVVNAADISLGLYAGITIRGVAGYTYGILYSTDLTDTNAWQSLTNLTLQQPVEIWVDTTIDVRSSPKRFYRVQAVP